MPMNCASKLSRGLAAATCLVLAANVASWCAAQEGMPHLRKQGAATQLIVDGKPFVVLAGELHNSSASNLAYLAGVWPKLASLRLNTVLAPVSWELTEPEEGRFDFSLVDGLVALARQHRMRLVLLWFGSWKNGVSSYAPAWVKRDTRRFPRCLGSSNRNVKDVLTPLSEANLKADARAFAALMRRLREIDGNDHTVVMVQVENEVGIKPEPRDLSPQADEAFAAPVPAALMDYLAAHKDDLHPELREAWERQGGKRLGTWTEVFGAGQAEEAFSAWHYARYINAVAAAGKAEYPLPMYVNAWLRGPNDRLGTYPSGGPVAHVLDIWRAAGTAVDLFAPDIYLPDFQGVCAEYTRGGNPLFIPEALRDDQAAARVFWAIGQHHAIGFAPFGIESVDPLRHPLAESYAILGQLLPLITRYQGTDRMAGLYQQDRDQQPPEPIRVGDWNVLARYQDRGLPSGAPRYGLILETGAEEFIVAGYGIEVGFGARTAGPKHSAILSVEMGRFERDQFVSELRLNGDESGANHRAKIPPNPANLFLDPARPRILRVRLYRYD